MNFTDPRLSPCPFCGNDEIMITRREVFDKHLTKVGKKVFQIIVFCQRCSAQVDTVGFTARRDKNEAIEDETIGKWNRRVCLKQPR